MRKTINEIKARIQARTANGGFNKIQTAMAAEAKAGKKLTVYDKAKQIAEDGLNKKDVFRFFNATEKGLLDYIVLFTQFGVADAKISALYEEWQNA